jgi:hypothetical protein
MFRFFPPATGAELWAGLVLIALSLLGAAWVIKCRAEALALEHDSVNRVGKVMRLWKTPNHGGWYYRVEYEYAAPPELDVQIFRNATELPKEHFDRLHEGGPITVKVCRTDPANHQVVGERHRVFSSTAVLFFNLGLLALLALGGIMNLWWWWISHRKLGPAQVVVLHMKIAR